MTHGVPLPLAARAEILLPALDGLQALLEGIATFDQWARLAGLVGLAQGLEALGASRGMKGHFDSAHRALVAVYNRVQQFPGGPTWGKTTPIYFEECATLRTAIELHDSQLQQCTDTQLQAARDWAARNLVMASLLARLGVGRPDAQPPQPVQEKLL